jgi:hypothetical protein
MNPVFVKLFLETDADDLPADEEKRRRGRWARGNRSGMVTRGRGPQPGSQAAALWLECLARLGVQLEWPRRPGCSGCVREGSRGFPLRPAGPTGAPADPWCGAAD